jgi:putative transposase
MDLVRTRRELICENGMLRHQIVVLRRKSPRPRLTTQDRLRLLAAAALLPTWRRALAIVQPETLLRWHREGFRRFWRRRSRSVPTKQRLASATVILIREMAAKNPLWGAERIRGELLKLSIRVSKRTIQRYMRPSRQHNGGQTWSTFIRSHAHEIWCCDFVQAHDVLFRPLFLFFLVNQGSRRVVHVAATRSPTQEWTARQLREATIGGAAPRFLIRDRDEKFGATFDRVAEEAGARVIKTAVRAPNMNAVAERFVGSLRREALDHLMLLGEKHLGRVSDEYAHYFNKSRPHQGIRQRIPDGLTNGGHDGEILAVPVLAGLHHHYFRAA